MLQVVQKDENTKYIVGNNIRERREELGLSQDQLADLMGTSRQMVSRHESGSSEMGISVLVQYKEALQISSEGLLTPKANKLRDKRAYLAGQMESLSEEDLDILEIMIKRFKS